MTEEAGRLVFRLSRSVLSESLGGYLAKTTMEGNYIIYMGPYRDELSQY